MCVSLSPCRHVKSNTFHLIWQQHVSHNNVKCTTSQYCISLHLLYMNGHASRLQTWSIRSIRIEVAPVPVSLRVGCQSPKEQLTAPAMSSSWCVGRGCCCNYCLGIISHRIVSNIKLSGHKDNVSQGFEWETSDSSLTFKGLKRETDNACCSRFKGRKLKAFSQLTCLFSCEIAY